MERIERSVRRMLEMGGAAARDPSARAGLNSGPRRGGSALRDGRDRLDAWDAGLVSSIAKPVGKEIQKRAHARQQCLALG